MELEGNIDPAAAALAAKPGTAAAALAVQPAAAGPAAPVATAAAAPARQPVALGELRTTVVDRALRGEGSLQLQVTPPDLGNLDMHIHLRDGAVFVRLQADSAAVAQHLEQQAQTFDDSAAGRPRFAAGGRLAGDADAAPPGASLSPAARRHRGMLDVIA